ncbi:MAG: 4-oxalocrotonate tautomerase [Rhodocyclaceae bacterium]|nr:4-oxalocrotonate tautomerase [Rhodocyclaceae bacterium]MBX3667075.1 4-oxalocrotonate tautomerase [Rhodocyclaceae bacterium]
MPTYHIEMFEGRSHEEKRELVAAITEATCRVLNCAPGAVDIIIHDIPRHNWATAGKLWSEQSN